MRRAPEIALLIPQVTERLLIEQPKAIRSDKILTSVMFHGRHKNSPGQPVRFHAKPLRWSQMRPS